jgi:type VI secretion system secreted protein Hcp
MNRSKVLSLVLLAVLLAVLPAAMSSGDVVHDIAIEPAQNHAGDYYLKIDEIRGESRAAGFEGQIEVLSLSWGTSQTGRTGSGAGAGKATFREFTITKKTDTASVPLIEAATIGQMIPEAVLQVRSVGGDESRDYFTVTLTNVTVVSFESGGSSGERPIEQLSLRYETVGFEHKGADGETFEFGWDLERNTRL